MALLRLECPPEVLAALQSLFKRKRDVSIYLLWRGAAQVRGVWAQLYLQLTAEVEQQAVAEVANRTLGFASDSLISSLAWKPTRRNCTGSRF